MIELDVIAQALYKADVRPTDWKRADPQIRAHYRMAARTALEALMSMISVDAIDRARIMSLADRQRLENLLYLRSMKANNLHVRISGKDVEWLMDRLLEMTAGAQANLVLDTAARLLPASSPNHSG